MDVKYEVKGTEQLLAKFNSAVVTSYLREAGQKSAVEVHRRAATYPPQRSGSTYRRTRRLGNSWAMAVQAYGGDIQSIVSNPTDYGGYVMGTQDQADVHAGRWPTERKILIEMRQKIIGFYSYAVQQIRTALG